MSYEVNLPKTDFPMRGNLPENEPKRIEAWEKNQIYAEMVAKNRDKTPFVMPDGPPYANGSIHIGHVLNKVLKDIVIKYKNMQGFRAEFIPGWDCHGLPIELKVTKELGDKKNSLSKKEIRDLCRKEARKWVDHQMEQFKRLGVLGRWEDPYLTMNPDYEAEEIRVLAQVQRNGLLYRGEKPVYWCPQLQTALAAAEVEYQDHRSPSIYVKFNVKKATGPLAKIDGPLSFVIWTTTPWTLPANLAIALNENFEYGVYAANGDKILIATELAEAVGKDIDVPLGEPLAVIKGKELEGLLAEHPFMGRTSQIVLGDHVSLEAGTGCVHIAPGHGLDDYMVGLKYGLPVLSPVNEGGLYTEEVPKYKGIHIWKANKIIVEDLRESGHLLGFKEITHSYPHNPRSKTPLIFRATPQWFVRMDDDYGLRKRALMAAEKDISFVPEWGRPRLLAMIGHTPDWCLSRQRTWGVPIPVFFCESCGEALADADVMENIANLMAKSGQGIEAYFEEDIPTLTLNKSCKKCGHKGFQRSGDILDVWFDSGVCHTAVQKKEKGLGFPADIYLEGSDQHRGWFQTSLISSIAAYGEAPFKSLITHGFVNDAQGHKMSKSKGNVIDPQAVYSQYGAEILRLWVAYEDYGQDVSVSEEMFKRVSETYRRIRNTMRFLLGNLHDFDPAQDLVEYRSMPAVDRWALNRLNHLVASCTQAYDSYDFFKVYHHLNTFFTVDLSAFYLDVLKDRLYTGAITGHERRSSQTVFYHLLNRTCGLMAPILSFLAEETYQYVPGKKEKSVFLTSFPKFNGAWDEAKLMDQFDLIHSVRDKAQALMEELRRDKKIGASLDAKLTLSFDGPTFDALQGLSLNELRELMIVSEIKLEKGNSGVHAEKAEGEKCPRCWHYSKDIGRHKDHTTICPKCIGALGF